MTLSHLDKGLARNNEHLFKKERRFLIRLLTGQPKTCYENLSLDEIISRCCARLSLVTLRFWRVNGASVVVGYGNECAKTVDIVACKNSRVRIIRRFSGGGSVFLSEKCLNYTIIIPQTLSNGLRHISPSFQAINGMVVDTLKEFQLPAKVEEDTDVAVNSRKIAGSSQSRRWGVLCHQGTILIESETENIEKLIKNPTLRSPWCLRARQQSALYAHTFIVILSKSSAMHASGEKVPSSQASNSINLINPWKMEILLRFIFNEKTTKQVRN